MTDDVADISRLGNNVRTQITKAYDSAKEWVDDKVDEYIGDVPGAIKDNVSESNDTEDPSAISEEDRKKLQPFIFNSPTVFQYPQNLTDPVPDAPEQLHSVRFMINVRENSRVADLTSGSLNSFMGPVRQRQLEVVDNSEQNRLTAEQKQTVVKGTATVAAIGAGLSVISSKSNLVGKGIAGAVAGGAGYVASSGVIETVKTLRTLGMIDLYISQPPVAKYSANWENKELGALAGLSEGISEASNLEEVIRSTKGLGELALRGAIQAAANLPAGLGITGDIGSSLELASSKVANPYKEQLFNSIGFRQFAFAYKFTPRNPSEYDNIKNIIRLFKYHMHPENDPTGLFLEYPSEFDITYLYKGEENKELNKISTCALTDMKVTYGNQDAFTTIKDTKRPGAPAEINMELAFTELEALTNDRIADGL